MPGSETSTNRTDGGWESSAEAWIADMGEHGDFGRQFVLDPVMTSRVQQRRYTRALDVGCGEGRFCRKLRELGIPATGIDPTERLLQEARKKDPDGTYRLGIGEQLPFPAESFDLVISYLSLIDIEPFTAAISEMNRVLEPGGTILIANLTSFTTARSSDGWERTPSGDSLYFKMDGYLDERSTEESWRGIQVRNWHRPLSAYMRAFLSHGLTLTFFDEPSPIDTSSPKAKRYLRAPWYVVMEWKKKS